MYSYVEHNIPSVEPKTVKSTLSVKLAYITEPLTQASAFARTPKSHERKDTYEPNHRKPLKIENNKQVYT